MPRDWPDPRTATDAAAFVEAMRQVRVRTGHSYRALERRAEQAGLVMPSSTISAALARDKLPRPELVEAFVRAAGADEETTERWLAVRADLAAGGPEVVPEVAVPRKPGRRRLAYSLVAVLTLAVVAVVAVVMLDGSGAGSPPPPQAQSPAASGASPHPIRVAMTGMCLGEGPEMFKVERRDVIGQHPCDTAQPSMSLERFPRDTVRILLQHPEHGIGCVTVDYGGTSTGNLLAGAACEDPPRPDQLFTAEKVANGYRLHSVAGPRWCIGVYEARVDPGVQLIQEECTGGAHEVFQIDGL